MKIEDYAAELLWAIAGLLVGIAAFLMFRVPFGFDWLSLVLIPAGVALASLARRKPWEKR